MFISILILILLLPITFLSLALDTFFSSEELGEMGISIGNSSVTVDLPKTYCIENACQLWNVTEQVMG